MTDNALPVGEGVQVGAVEFTDVAHQGKPGFRIDLKPVGPVITGDVATGLHAGYGDITVLPADTGQQATAFPGVSCRSSGIYLM